MSVASAVAWAAAAAVVFAEIAVSCAASAAARAVVSSAMAVVAASAVVCTAVAVPSTAVMRASLSFTAVSTESKFALTSSASATVLFTNVFGTLTVPATTTSGIASSTSNTGKPSAVRRLRNTHAAVADSAIASTIMPMPGNVGTETGTPQTISPQLSPQAASAVCGSTRSTKIQSNAVRFFIIDSLTARSRYPSLLRILHRIICGLKGLGSSPIGLHLGTESVPD